MCTSVTKLTAVDSFAVEQQNNYSSNSRALSVDVVCSAGDDHRRTVVGRLDRAGGRRRRTRLQRHRRAASRRHLVPSPGRPARRRRRGTRK